MPQDKDGRELVVGDTVVLVGTVRELAQSGQGARATVDIPADGGIAPLTVDAKTVGKVEKDTVVGEPPRDLKVLEEKISAYPILRYFTYEHLPSHLQEISRPFSQLAWKLVLGVSWNKVETEAALRKMLEAKDAAVRAGLAPKKP